MIILYIVGYMIIGGAVSIIAEVVTKEKMDIEDVTLYGFIWPLMSVTLVAYLSRIAILSIARRVSK